MLSYPIQNTSRTFPVSITVNLFLDAAKELGIDYEFITDTRLIRFSYQGHEEFLIGQRSSHLSFIASHCIDDKFMTRALLKRANLSVANGFRCDSLEALPGLLRQLTFPVVCKPHDGAHGHHVFPNLSSLEEVTVAAKILLRAADFFLIEEMFDGTEYRIALTPDNVFAVTQRIPANITGDGQHTIEELIKKKNKDPRRGDKGGYLLPLTAISIDDALRQHLSSLGLRLDSVPKLNETIFLNLVSKLSQGGDSLDITELVHPSVFALAKRAITAIPNLPFAGLDFMTTDITAEQTDDSYIVLELNASPALYMHDLPFKGENRGVAKAFILELFPECSSV